MQEMSKQDSNTNHLTPLFIGTILILLGFSSDILFLFLGIFFILGFFAWKHLMQSVMKRRRLLEEATFRVDLIQDSFSEFHSTESFVIPKHCPACKQSITLKELEWTDDGSAKCNNCGHLLDFE